jgi:hypothetical protein
MVGEGGGHKSPRDVALFVCRMVATAVGHVYRMDVVVENRLRQPNADRVEFLVTT